MTTLGGFIFIHNAIEFDFCIKEAIESLLPICDKVIVANLESTDETMDIITNISSKVEVIQDKWFTPDGTPQWKKLADIANKVKSHLNTKWHFMLQADEVLHESSYKKIDSIVHNNNGNSAWVRRINLYKDFNHYISFKTDRKPCGDELIRLARHYVKAHGDAENLLKRDVCFDSLEDITIFHYSYVRNPYKMVDKVNSMMPWFHGSEEKRFIKYKEENKPFKPDDIIQDSELSKLDMKHPWIAKRWVDERRHFFG